MNRGVLLAATLLLIGSLPPGAASAQSLWQPELKKPAGVLPPLPPPPPQHTRIPPLPPGGSGFALDPQTGQYVAEGGKAIWVPGHNQSGPGGQTWVEGQWMYPKPPKEGYGR